MSLFIRCSERVVAVRREIEKLIGSNVRKSHLTVLFPSLHVRNTVSRMDIVLLDGEKVRIIEEWIPRWQFLLDYRSEMGNEVVWTYTDKSILASWIQLNLNMDYYVEAEDYTVRRLNHEEAETVQRRYKTTQPQDLFCDRLADVTGIPTVPITADGRQLVPGPSQVCGQAMPVKTIRLSSLYTVIDFMRPTTSRYLLYVEIDNMLPFQLRKSSYRQLGEYIVKARLSPWGREIIGSVECICIDDWDWMRGIFSTYLYCDVTPLMRQNTQEEAHIQLYGLQAIQLLLLRSPLIDLMGIMRSCVQSYGRDMYMCANWEDVKDIVFSAEALEIHKQVLALRGEDESLISKYKEQLSLHMQAFFPDLSHDPLPVLVLSRVPIRNQLKDSGANWYIEGSMGSGGMTIGKLVDLLAFQASHCDESQLGLVMSLIGIDYLLPSGCIEPFTITRSAMVGSLLRNIVSDYCEKRIRPSKSAEHRFLLRNIAGKLGLKYLKLAACVATRAIEIGKRGTNTTNVPELDLLVNNITTVLDSKKAALIVRK